MTLGYLDPGIRICFASTTVYEENYLHIESTGEKEDQYADVSFIMLENFLKQHAFTSLQLL